MKVSVANRLVFSTRLEPLSEDLALLLDKAAVDFVRAPMLEDTLSPEVREAEFQKLLEFQNSLASKEKPWIVFTSMRSIALALNQADVSSYLKGLKIAVLSPVAAQRFEQRGFKVSFIASRANSTVFVSELLARLEGLSPQVIIFLRGKEVSGDIPEQIIASEHDYFEHIIYDLEKRSFSSVELKLVCDTMLKLVELNKQTKATLLASDVRSMRYLLEILPASLSSKLKLVPVVCIGEATKAGVESLGFFNVSLAAENSMRSLVQSVIK